MDRPLAGYSPAFFLQTKENFSLNTCKLISECPEAKTKKQNLPVFYPLWFEE
jgi:hypothetical protein